MPTRDDAADFFTEKSKEIGAATNKTPINRDPIRLRRLLRKRLKENPDDAVFLCSQKNPEDKGVVWEWEVKTELDIPNVIAKALREVRPDDGGFVVKRKPMLLAL
ncbi:MAG: hypothetical protein CMI56_02470 [Parcubacteria group bacterium]|nr:hypothetical protein [Parcubacteria group bacterium]|tara:strand:- start:6568 stop:6882 length:315 start_codon:yes stop_codon:yes gene_type:complete